MLIIQVYDSKIESVQVIVCNENGSVSVNGTQKLYFDDGLTASNEFVSNLIKEYYKKICNE